MSCTSWGVGVRQKRRWAQRHATMYEAPGRMRRGAVMRPVSVTLGRGLRRARPPWERHFVGASLRVLRICVASVLAKALDYRTCCPSDCVQLTARSRLC